MKIKFMSELLLKPIGFLKSMQTEAYQAGRQPDPLGLPAEIHFEPHQQFEQALQDLDGCSHIWVLFGFHKNENWKPLVQTPRSHRKIGVFATRAPYRPNPIGMSLVKLISVTRLKIEIGENDLLDGTPIYDIKPYHPESDHVENSKIDWLENSISQKFQLYFSPLIEEQIDWLEKNKLQELRTFIQRQLEYDPTNKNKKRVEENSGYWTLSYRTWRVDFSLSESRIGLLSVRSGYTQDELLSTEDKYNDKGLHRLFIQNFS